MSVLHRLGSCGVLAVLTFSGACSSTGDELATDDTVVSTAPEREAREFTEPSSTTGDGDASTVTTDDASDRTSTTLQRRSDSDPSTTVGETGESTTTSAAAGAADAPTTSTAGDNGTSSSMPPSSEATVAPTTASTTSTTTSSTTTTSTTTTTTSTTTTTAAPTSLPSRIELPAAVASTEGVAADAASGRLFVGELNNGNVWAGTPTGSWELFNRGSSVGRSTAFGLAVDVARNRLYVVSGVDGRVDVLDLTSGALVTSIAVPVAGGSLINDVGIAPDGTAYVTDTGAARLYRIAAGGSTAELWVDYSGQVDTNRTQHGNGVVADGSVVLVAYMEQGELLRFDRSTGAVSVVSIAGASTAGRDGLVLCGNRLYGVEISSITGTEGVWVTDLNAARTSGTSQGRIGASELSGASTAAVLQGQLVVNNAQFGVTPKYAPFDLTTLDAAC